MSKPPHARGFLLFRDFFEDALEDGGMMFGKLMGFASVCYTMAMKRDASKISRAPLSVVFEREEDGRWIAEVQKLPGVLAYGNTKQEARTKAYAIALRTLADTVEQGHTPSSVSKMFYAVARG